MVILGLDIGSNSVGSAWVDTDKKEIHLAVSVFPAGVEEQRDKRGAPKNQHRREKRSLRRAIARRARRKHMLRKVLIEAALLPSDPEELHRIFYPPSQEEAERWDPWTLRREALERELHPYEFGRILVHMAQRRGALGVTTAGDRRDDAGASTEEGRVKEAIDRLRKEMQKRNARTYGELMAILRDERKHPLPGKHHVTYSDPIRNRRDSFEFHADRQLIREEFHKIWEKQKSFGGRLAELLTDELLLKLDDPSEDETWLHKGILFGQRRTYWKVSTLGRCELEPTDRCCPLADMYAQEFRVIETVNNIRIEERGKPPRSLTPEERAKVIDYLRKSKTASPASIRKVLGLNKKEIKPFVSLNIERDPNRQINTDWFYREIVHGVLGESRWLKMTEREKESVNNAILKFNPDKPEHEEKLRAGAKKWWGLSDDQVDRLIQAWKGRPKLEKRLNFSRRAIKNLLPYMSQAIRRSGPTNSEFDPINHRWPTVNEARQMFAEDATNGASPEQRERYSLKHRVLRKADRHFLKKHPDLLPPAPVLANPVVRKAIHEVRRHVIAYIRKFGRKPDRIVVELARSARQSARVRNAKLALNRKREKIRKQIIEEFGLGRLPLNQQRAAVERVLLCRQQKGVCAYSGRRITDREAAAGMTGDGSRLEIDHIVPWSRSHDNSLNNKVLCFADTNRDKGNRTVKEWLGEGSKAFEELEQRFGHLEKGKPVEEYFTKEDYARKWENLHRDAPEVEEFVESQLTDTAYASRQVVAYLRDALYGGESDGSRRVFTTKGIYTAILRRHWGLIESNLDAELHGIKDEAAGAGDPGIARKGEKTRISHLHHAIDALVIAFSTPDRIQQLARLAQEQETSGAKATRNKKKLPPPWGTPEEFRRQVVDAMRKIVVCHRPVKRKIVGAFHEDTMYGPTDQPDQFTNRIPAENLTPNHLRVPDGWDELSQKLEDPAISEAEKKQIRSRLAEMPDLPPGKSGIVRDRALRDQIRKCLRRNGIDPDGFKSREIQDLVRRGELRLQSGVPIKSVVLLRTHKDPIVVPRKKWDDKLGRYVPDPNPRAKRVYVGGNNHHIEILEDVRTGKWTGEVVTMFEAARRVRVEKRDPVDRSDRDGKRFVMSLSEGEVIYACRPNKGPNGSGTAEYFVVVKIDKYPARIYFASHWDARSANEQDRWNIVPSKLKECGLAPGEPPQKVWISPLGEVRPLVRH